MTGFESVFFGEAAKSLAGLVLKTAWEVGNKPIDEPIKRLIFTASGQYVQNYEQRHGNLKVVCVRMDAPVRLDEVYTAVQVLERSQVGYFESAATLQDLFREKGRGFEFQKIERQDGITVANQQQYLMVLGSPGVGKSTFLRKVGLEALKQKKGAFQHECLPVFLKLQDFNSTEITLDQLIIHEFATCGFPEPEKTAKSFLQKGKLLILLDGLDEVATDHVDRAITQIQNFGDRHRNNRFIASCRIAAYKSGFQRFKDIVIAAFDDGQIEEFIRHWFRLEPEIASQCWDLLKQTEYAATKELAQTPLLLTLLCVVYDESQNFPKNRAAVYGEALDVLLKKWAAEKRLKRDPIYRELSPELEQILLAEIAYTSFAADQLFFSKREVTRQIKDFLVNNLNAPQHLDGEAVLTAIEVQQGLFVERARDTYSFSHLTFQEYLTAQHLAQQPDLMQALVEQHLTDDRWREVFLLVAGSLSNATPLLELMAAKTPTLLATEKLKALVNWVDSATAGSLGDYKPAAKRVAALTLTLHLSQSIDLNLDFSRSLDLNLDLSRFLDFNLSLDLYHFFFHLDRSRFFSLNRPREFAKIKIFKQVDFTVLMARLSGLKARIPEGELSEEFYQRFANQLVQIWCGALHLQPEWLELSEQEVESLKKYLSANQLLIRCKEAAVRVSRESWAGIEQRMLTVEDEEKV
ncbi:MAG: histidine kinase [Leptolyngbya sp.]|nr:MAG: histidine kinase [Leptolyngbya sp.]